MNGSSGFRFLRPYLQKDLPAARKSAYLRFFTTTRCPQNAATKGSSHAAVGKAITAEVEFRGNIHERVEELKVARALEWPRIKSDTQSMTTAEFAEKYKEMKIGEQKHDEYVLLRGRVRGIRSASSALVFIDIVQEGRAIQGVCNRSRIDAFGATINRKFKEFSHLVRRGDIVSIYGNPYVTKRGELSLNVVELPQILSPSLASHPKTLTDRETRIRNRHVDLLVNNEVADTLRLRSHIIQHLRDFLLKDNFLEVQTPLISDKAGGAIAKPFTTVATEFSEKQLALRIAPEIWLKRLIIGGMDRVFEIGPAFRNEGLDATHNPEFTTCEFYKAFADLEDLILMTENLLSGMAKLVKKLQAFPLKNLPELDITQFSTPFNRIAFIPGIEAELGEKLPPLTSHTAEDQLIALFTKHSLPLPTSPTLPRLLDKLASIYIEPLCFSPTFITHHPACMAPLSKSFLCPTTSQLVSARAELFIQHREIANMYEEENSPFEQRGKFVEQLKWKDDENRAGVDESYLEALEWALPPTGGWGAGVDRLVMLFSGARRISDVLAFGSLRNVVNLGNLGLSTGIGLEGEKNGVSDVKEKDEDDV